MKNALAMILLAQGTPLILAGDEFTNSQQGNNNPYCIDNEISWVNWKNNNDSTEILNWTKQLISIRKKYGILHSRYRLTQSDSLSSGYPDVSFHGLNAWYADMYNYCRQIGIMYSYTYSDKDIILEIEQYMNEGRNGFEVVLKSCDKKENIYIDSEKRKVVMPPRSMAVLIGEYPERKTTMDVKKKASKNKK